MDTWFPASFVYRASAWRSTAARSATRPSFVAPLTTGVPTVGAGSATSCVTATTSDGAVVLAFDDERPDRDHRPVHGRVDVAADRRAYVEGGRGPAAELVPLRRAAAAAEDAVHDPLHEPLVRLAPDGLERERPVVRRVVADRGQAALRDRQLQPHRPAQRHDLGSRPRLGDRGLALARDDERPLRRSPAECGEAEGHEEDRG